MKNLSNQQKTFLFGVVAGAVGLTVLRNTSVSIGAITTNRSMAKDLCMDGRFTTSRVPGRCSYHGGVNPAGLTRRQLKQIKKAEQLSFF